ncbi:MAG: hypothetical protein H6813_05245 [Phycisphaeraceae bacterium]|nr:hypothetical protein [Phycisphaeraceae bacterium]MCB9847789.1 hypothetical protein [Phycisphaeraceae bacterium]
MQPATSPVKRSLLAPIARPAAVASLAAMLTLAAHAGAPGPNTGVIEPALTSTTGQTVVIPNTDQASGSQLLNMVGGPVETNVIGAQSLTGHTITSANSPNRDLRNGLDSLAVAANGGDTAGMTAAAQDLMDILLGNTQGRIYDGFAMLNYNRGAFAPGHVPGEYKMKTLTDSGLTAPGIDGQPRKIWETAVNFLWYDGQFDSDTFLLRVPVAAHEFDTMRIHFRIYSLVTEDFAPTCVMLDHRLPGSVQFPYKGFDAVWEKIQNDKVTEITVDFPPVRLLRGVYTWGWRVHPPRIQFLQPVYEMVNAHTGAVELEPQGLSYAYRNAQLSIDDIGDAAPEKKIYTVAQAVLGGATPAQTLAMLTDAITAPAGVWQGWADLLENQNGLPQEAWDALASQGLSPGNFGDYDYVSAYMNNEMYGDGPNGNRITGWLQGDRLKVALVNLDNHTHYFRNVDFGAKLTNDIDAGSFPSGSHSFEVMNFKPTYGAPKVAEMQWRAGWGFRPHFDVIQQSDVFSRLADNVMTLEFTDGHGRTHSGWQYDADIRGGDFRFNPPNFIIESPEHPSPSRLKDADGLDGLVIGQLTEGYGVARMCDHLEHPLGGFCQNDIGPYNPNGALNVDTDGDGVNDVLWFPPFLRNPNPAGGDIIPPTPAWKPFLWINPNNGTLFIDPSDPSQGYWSDLTYSHGAPIAPGATLSAHIQAPRASAQVFYQFDDCFHDNAIFSPHPTFSPGSLITPDLNNDGIVDTADLGILLGSFGSNNPAADVNGDGVVDTADLGILIGAFGTAG